MAEALERKAKRVVIGYATVSANPSIYEELTKLPCERLKAIYLSAEMMSTLRGYYAVATHLRDQVDLIMRRKKCY